MSHQTVASWDTFSGVELSILLFWFTYHNFCTWRLLKLWYLVMRLRRWVLVSPRTFKLLRKLSSCSRLSIYQAYAWFLGNSISFQGSLLHLFWLLLAYLLSRKMAYLSLSLAHLRFFVIDILQLAHIQGKNYLHYLSC